MAAIKKFTERVNERQRALELLAEMKRMEKKRRLVSVRIDERTVVAAPRKRIKEVVELHTKGKRYGTQI